MAMNFNIVQKPKKEDEDDDELLDEEELEESSSKKSSSSVDPKKKMYRFMGMIVAIFLGFIILLFIITSIAGGNKKYSYTEIESIMKDAAKSYFSENKGMLPTEVGDITEIDSTNLVAAEKMKDLSEYVEEDVACTGTVQVEKTDSGYLYTPYLSCGNTYTTIELSKKIIEKEEIVTSGYGLYSTRNGHIFRGEGVNNYVQLDEALWRIVKITDDNNVVLVLQESVGYGNPWDDRYNPDKLYEAGVNTYSNSRIREYLEKVYNNPAEKDGELILSKSDKKKLVPFTMCIAKRSANSESKDNSEECTETLKDQMLGLLTLSDYMYASVDENCKNSTSKSCKNYNYLSNKTNWWLATGVKEDSANVFQVSTSGDANVVDAGNYGNVRPVIYLNSKTLYKSGNGSLEKPYKVR